MSRNRILILVIFMVFVQAVSAQDLFTFGASPNLHFFHKVSHKETWYSISRKFNLTPKEIAAFNNLNLDKPLEIGQNIKVPLTSANFLQDDLVGSVDEFAPVFHIVQDKEWMYRISVNHNKVPIEKLEKWNSISFDQAKPGMKLIVGYMKLRDGNAVAPVNKSPEEKAAIAKQETVSKKEPAAINKPKEGGYFKTDYDENGKNYSGVSGIFKSTSGWNDGKYYALMNNVTVGTIVQVKLPQTNKSIYAKVLGELPDMKESAGLALRISDAAARELGAVNNKFSVDVKY